MEKTQHVMSIEEVEEWLCQVAEQLPEELFNQLNGGIVLQKEPLPSPKGKNLYILGTYHNEPFGLGRYITIYYGSFVKVHGGGILCQQKKALKHLLRHELTHHIESLAGVRDLEWKDEEFLRQYDEE